MMGGYCTMLQDGGKYRLWYESYLPFETLDEQAHICYAESDDGASWKRPNLGIIEYRGSKENNLVYSNGHGASIFIDPTAMPAERYKMIHLDKVPLQMVNGRQINAFLFGAVSSDGIHWKRLPEPVIKHTSDTSLSSNMTLASASMWHICADGTRNPAQATVDAASWCVSSPQSSETFRSQSRCSHWGRRIVRMPIFTRAPISDGLVLRVPG